MKSMTGFGASGFHDENYDIEIEIKSVNSRFLDLKIVSPRELQFLDNLIKDHISKSILRAKIDVRIFFTDKRVPDLFLDENKVKAYYNLLLKAKALINDQTPLNLETLLSQPDVLSIQNPSYQSEDFISLFSKTLNEAIAKHQEMALQEGKKLQLFFESAYNNITGAAEKILASIPHFREKLYQDLLENIKSLMKEKYSEDFEKRVMLETAFYLDKADITEEIIRLKSHLSNFKHKIAEDESDNGKALNFVFQEMQREINTISAKYNTSSVFNDILLMKEEVERCREQIQNIE